MVDVWVYGVFTPGVSKGARGAWICPDLKLYGIARRTTAFDMQDGSRMGCAMAILSAVDTLGENVVIHVPTYPNPRWLINPNHHVPMANLLYRLLYKTEIHPRILHMKMGIIVESSPKEEEILLRLLRGGEVPPKYSPCC